MLLATTNQRTYSARGTVPYGLNLPEVAFPKTPSVASCLIAFSAKIPLMSLKRTAAVGFGVGVGVATAAGEAATVAAACGDAVACDCWLLPEHAASGRAIIASRATDRTCIFFSL